MQGASCRWRVEGGGCRDLGARSRVCFLSLLGVGDVVVLPSGSSGVVLSPMLNDVVPRAGGVVEG